MSAEKEPLFMCTHAHIYTHMHYFNVFMFAGTLYHARNLDFGAKLG